MPVSAAGSVVGGAVLVLLVAGGAVVTVLWSGARPDRRTRPVEPADRVDVALGPDGVPAAAGRLSLPGQRYGPVGQTTQGAGGGPGDAGNRHPPAGRVLDVPDRLQHEPLAVLGLLPPTGGLEEIGGSTYQKWDFVVFVNESTSTFSCDPP